MKKNTSANPADLNQTFQYSLLMKLIYRYANIPVTLLMVVYLIPIIVVYNGEYLQIISILFLVLIIAAINIFFIKNYSVIPYIIKTDDTKITITGFMMNDRTEDILYSSITNLSGGIFEGRINGLLKVHYGEEKYFAFFQRIQNAKLLQAILLSKVERQLYDKVLNSLSLPPSALKKK